MRDLLEKLTKCLARFARRPVPSQEIDEGELISRYILTSNHYAATTGRVKPATFMPHENGETSVYRIDGLVEKNVWQIGEAFVAKPRNKRLYGRADFFASIVHKTGLDIVPDTKPHSRHANIVNWPPEKHEKMQIATEIANSAMLQLKAR